jgi:hypothetical protein
VEGLSRALATLGIVAFMAAPPASAARSDWECSYQDYGSGSAHYVVHFEPRGNELIEPHWPAPIAYHILVDTHDMLIAARAYIIAPTFRGDARGAATLLIINKVTGHLRRSSSESGKENDQVSYGNCEKPG